jgi:precorrin-4 methylase
MLHLEAYAKRDRREALQLAIDAIASSGAWVLDSHLFSGIAVAIVFEIAWQDLGRLLTTLRDAGLTVDDPAEARDAAARSGDLFGTLRLNFVDGDPSVRRIVPAVPG